MGWLRLAAAAGCALLLTGCAFTSGSSPAKRVQPKEPHVLEFWVNTQLSSDILQQADRLADRVFALSEGSLRITVTPGTPDQGTLSRGECDVTLLSTIQLAQMEPVFSMFSLPFIYDGEGHMSVSMNSEEMQQRLRDRLQPHDVRPMAVIYNGSSTIVNTKQGLHTAEDFMDLALAMRTDNADKLAIFEVFKADVLPYVQTSLAGLMGQRVEILPEDLTLPSDYVTIDAIETPLTAIREIPAPAEDLYISATSHTISMLWLCMNKSSWDSLSAYERAVLQEGYAGLIAGIEDIRIEDEGQLLRQLEEGGASIDTLDRRQVAEWVYGEDGTGSRLYTPPAYLDAKLYELVQSFSG